MDLPTLKGRLTALGCYAGTADGAYDDAARAAILQALTNGPDYRLAEADVVSAAAEHQIDPDRVWAVHDVESTGNPFLGGRPTILFEPHRFSKATGHRFDASHPHISSLVWDRSLYPATQQGRWDQLLEAVGLDVDAGFASASYGGFQILGENYEVCDAACPWDFAWRQSQTEADQLYAFFLFIERRSLIGALRAGDWAAFARGYNGTAYRENRYDDRLALAYAKRKGSS